MGMQVLDGNRLVSSGRLHDAAARYLSVGTESFDAVGAYNLANVFVRLGQNAAAEPLFALACASKDRRIAASAWYNQGVAWFAQGRYQEAASAFRRVLQGFPGKLDAAAAYEAAIAAMPKPDEAGLVEGGSMQEGPASGGTEAMNLSRHSEQSPFSSAPSTAAQHGDH